MSLSLVYDFAANGVVFSVFSSPIDPYFSSLFLDQLLFLNCLLSSNVRWITQNFDLSEYFPCNLSVVF